MKLSNVLFLTGLVAACGSLGGYVDPVKTDTDPDGLSDQLGETDVMEDSDAGWDTAEVTDTDGGAPPADTDDPGTGPGPGPGPGPTDTGSFNPPVPGDTGSFNPPLPGDTGTFNPPIPGDTGIFFPGDTSP